MNILKLETNQSKNRFFYTSNIKPDKYSSKIENKVINVYPTITYQTFYGFGAAITGASGYAYSLLPDNKKQEFMNDMFNNINYSLCRLTLGSSDFSIDSYSYSSKKDLSDFSIEKDLKYIVPFIKDALKINPNLHFLASPWSPPSFMKNTKLRNLGGKLLDKYKKTYANYFVKYIKAYKDLGINIDYVTIQNEPNAVQVWESCLFNSDEEADFLVNYLYPTFCENNINTKILIYDHNKEKLFSRALEEFSNPEALNSAAGIAFHWYTGSHFENISLCREAFPDKLLFHTEGCCGYNLENFFHNEYAYDIIGDLNAGINGYIDWNILLDSTGGPNHKKNFCNSPVMLTKDSLNYNKSLAYYYIGHFSKYIKPGAKRIAFSKYTDDLEITALKNNDNSIAIVILNKNSFNIDYNLCIESNMFKDTVEKQSIISYLIK